MRYFAISTADEKGEFIKILLTALNLPFEDVSDTYLKERAAQRQIDILESANAHYKNKTGTSLVKGEMSRLDHIHEVSANTHKKKVDISDLGPSVKIETYGPKKKFKKTNPDDMVEFMKEFDTKRKRISLNSNEMQ